jgi:hypothetical protein
MSTQQATFNQRSFLLRIYEASMVVVALYLALYPLLQPTNFKLLLMVMLGGALLGGYVITLRSKDFVHASHYYITCLYSILLTNGFISGGIGAPGIIWFLFCPLIAFITLSTHVARLWLIAIIITVALLFVFDQTLPIAKFHHYKVWYLVSYILFFPMVYLIMRIFRTEVSKKNVELNELNQKLRNEREMLKKTQQEILFQSLRIRDAEATAHERSSKLSYYLDQLIEIKRMDEVHSGNLEYSLQAILQFLQRSMMLRNVALWRSQGEGKPLELFRYVGDGSDIYERALLCREDFADAYDMLQTGAILNACDDRKESRQLKSLFQRSTGNDTMINCPYFLDGKFAGFISCRVSDKIWVAEDIIFVRAISDTISLAFKANYRKLQQQILEEKQREITEINESLERKVMERTLELNRRNQQLTDFAFTNAHHIRGPICRLLGLSNVLSLTRNEEEVLKIADYMCTSITELDAITRKTSEELNIIVE